MILALIIAFMLTMLYMCLIQGRAAEKEIELNAKRIKDRQAREEHGNVRL